MNCMEIPAKVLHYGVKEFFSQRLKKDLKFPEATLMIGSDIIVFPCEIDLTSKIGQDCIVELRLTAGEYMKPRVKVVRVRQDV